ncbi:MAG: DNA polymerase Y family protein [Chloroflexota bacterium]
MHLGCLLVDHLPVQVELARHPGLRGRPVVVAAAQGSRRVVLDASPRARGVAVGMPLEEAMARCKEAVLAEPDPAAYALAWEGVLDALERLAADVEDGGQGMAFVRLDNLRSLHGGLGPLVHAVLAAVPKHLTARLGTGSAKFTATAAAGMAPWQGHRAAPADPAPFLAPLSIDALPLPWKVRERLRGFGLATLGAVAGVGVGPLQAQLGREGRLAWELASGIDPRPFVPRRAQEVVSATLEFASPTLTLEAIGTGVEALLGRLFAQPRMRGRTARSCLLEGRVLDGPVWRRELTFREPVASARKGLTLLRASLEGGPPPGPLEELGLTLRALAGEAGRQASLFAEVRRHDDLREALRQLRARLRVEPPVYHIREVEPCSRVPERRTALVPFAP